MRNKMLIKPFCNIQTNVFNKNINFSSSSFVYNNSKRSILCKTQPAFYICRTTFQNHVCCGIIAQLNYNSSSKVYKHEECFSEKLSDLCFLFQKTKLQLSPTLLVHDNHSEIEKYLNLITTNFSPDMLLNHEKTTYEIWVVTPSKQIENLYKTITYLFIADGHHRVSCLFSLKKDVCAYIIQKKFLKAYPIIRRYHHFHTCPTLFFEKAKIFFNAKPLSNEELNLWQGEYFALVYGKNSIALSNSNSQKDFLKILSSFSSLNYIEEQKPSFTNYKCNLNNQQFNYHDKPEERNFHLFIPRINLDNYFPHPNKILPIHSSWFEPKIPPGIVQMEIT